MLLLESTQRSWARWELLSIGLEIVAFFLVTIELYGEERLQHLNTIVVQSYARSRLWLRFWNAKVSKGPASKSAFWFSRLVLYPSAGTLDFLGRIPSRWIAPACNDFGRAVSPGSRVHILMWANVDVP